jgi:hypothetical protein
MFPSRVGDISFFTEIQGGTILCFPGMGGIYDMYDSRFFKPAINYVRPAGKDFTADAFKLYLGDRLMPFVPSLLV